MKDVFEEKIEKKKLSNCQNWEKKKSQIIARTGQQMLQEMQGKDPEK